MAEYDFHLERGVVLIAVVGQVSECEENSKPRIRNRARARNLLRERNEKNLYTESRAMRAYRDIARASLEKSIIFRLS